VVASVAPPAPFVVLGKRGGQTEQWAAGRARYVQPGRTPKRIHYVWSVAWSLSGDQIASASEDRTVLVWDAKTGKPVSKLQSHSNDLMSVAWTLMENRLFRGLLTKQSSSGILPPSLSIIPRTRARTRAREPILIHYSPAVSFARSPTSAHAQAHAHPRTHAPMFNMNTILCKGPRTFTGQVTAHESKQRRRSTRRGQRRRRSLGLTAGTPGPGAPSPLAPRRRSRR
jgi:hypothetical protein